MRVLLTGGISAGHINPALAIAETVRMNDPTAEIAFVGLRGGKEEDLVPREGYPLRYVRSAGLRRPLWSPANLRVAYLALISPFEKQTTEILDDFQPDIVIGTGGYACWPIMAAAARRKIPTALHESNAIPGIAVKQLQGRVDRIWINFERTADRLRDKEKILRVGNPSRGGFGRLSREEARRELGLDEGRRMILSFGGSLGAEGVNAAVIRLMKEYSSKHPEVLHVHAAGKRDYAESLRQFREARLESAENCILLEYIYDMPLRMAAADLVISRAGAMTLSELALMKKAAILIPSPNVAENHQYKNAMALVDAGAAAIVEERQLDGDLLIPTVTDLLSSPERRARMEENIAAFADADANRKIWQDILRIVKKKSRNGKESKNNG